MSDDADGVDRLVRVELASMEPALRARVEPLLVRAYRQVRRWSYGPEEHETWTVLEHRASGTGVAYCATGFGPGSPWGLVWLTPDATPVFVAGIPAPERFNIGYDSSWFASLASAFLDSFAAADGPP